MTWESRSKRARSARLTKMTVGQLEDEFQKRYREEIEQAFEELPRKVRGIIDSLLASFMKVEKGYGDTWRLDHNGARTVVRTAVEEAARRVVDTLKMPDYIPDAPKFLEKAIDQAYREAFRSVLDHKLRERASAHAEAVVEARLAGLSGLKKTVPTSQWDNIYLTVWPGKVFDVTVVGLMEEDCLEVKVGKLDGIVHAHELVRAFGEYRIGTRFAAEVIHIDSSAEVMLLSERGAIHRPRES